MQTELHSTSTSSKHLAAESVGTGHILSPRELGQRCAKAVVLTAQREAVLERVQPDSSTRRWSTRWCRAAFFCVAESNALHSVRAFSPTSRNPDMYSISHCDTAHDETVPARLSPTVGDA